MEIPSGGTAGPRLAGSLRDLDDNVYGTLAGAPAPAAVASLFVQAGWRARRSSWTEYEVEHTWARLGLFQRSDGTVMFAGVADPDRVELLVESLSDLGLSCSVELWDPDRQVLLRTLSSGPRGGR